MKRVLLAAALVLAAPGGAAGATFGEVPSRAIGGGGSCLQATGAPGETVRAHTRDNTSPDGVEIVSSDLAGRLRANTLKADYFNGCPYAAARPDGAAVVAFRTSHYGQRGIRIGAALREPGGTWGPVVDIAADDESAGDRGFAVGVSDHADALLAIARHGVENRIEIDAVRRAAGAGFGGAERIFTAARTPRGATTVQAGMSASGEAIVAWAFQPRAGAARELWAAVAAPGTPFRAAVRVGELRRGGTFALGVGAGGHAVLAFSRGGALLVADRLPGADFGIATPVGVADDLYAEWPTAAVRADGGAVVAWLNAVDGAVHAVTRDREGVFGPAITVVAPVPIGVPRSVLAVLVEPPEAGEELLPGYGTTSELPNAAFGTGGALVTWVGPALAGGTWSNASQSATLTAGTVESRVHGAGIEDADAVVPVLLKNGGVGVQWETGQRLLHTAVAGLRERRDATAPKVHIGPPSSHTLKLGDSLDFPVTCSSACIVRAQVGTGAFSPSASTRLTHRGSQELSLGTTVGPIPAGSVPIRLRYGAPKARHAKTKTVVVHLRRTERLPLAEGLVARRDGDDVVITWRTDRLGPEHSFSVWASAERGTRALAHALPKTLGRRFVVRLRRVPTAKYVTLVTGTEDMIVRTRTVAVRG